MTTSSTIDQPPVARHQLTIPLAAHTLRFSVRATTPIALHDFAGSALRGALTGVLRRTFCPDQRAGGLHQPDPLHQAICPICQLLAAEQMDGAQGDVRRPYTLRPPLDGRSRYAPGETFTFELTLLGDNLTTLPFWVLAVGGVGELGLGRKEAAGRRGQFSVERIDAVQPLTGATLPMLLPGERMVRSETLPVRQADVEQAVERLLPQLAAAGNRLRLHFHTPTRLTHARQISKTPLPFPLIKQTVLRLLDLCAQHGGGRPSFIESTVAETTGEATGKGTGEGPDEARPLVVGDDIYPHAKAVTLVEDETRWWDVQGYSSRLGRKQMLGGFVGEATLHAVDWSPLLPWLLWGSVVGVGKNVVKGCGIYEVGI